VSLNAHMSFPTGEYPVECNIEEKGLHLQHGAAEKRSLNSDGYTSHAQRYRFFTRPALRTGQPWKISLNGALRLKTPHCA